MKDYLNYMRSIVARRCAELRELDIEAIRALPGYSPDASIYDDKVRCGVHHRSTPAGQHIVVAQAVRDSWFGMAYAVQLDGFAIEADGTRRELAENEKWEYD
jgi:hypothetical protein